MFTTNAVQASSVPTLQYQEHPQKSQGKNIENVQQKTQQTQQVLIVFWLHFLKMCINHNKKR